MYVHECVAQIGNECHDDEKKRGEKCCKTLICKKSK